MAGKYNTGTDWLAIEKRYVEGDESAPEVGEALKIPLPTIKKQSAARKWSEKRSAFRAENSPLLMVENSKGAAIARSGMIAGLAELRDLILGQLVENAK